MDYTKYNSKIIDQWVEDGWNGENQSVMKNILRPNKEILR